MAREEAHALKLYINQRKNPKRVCYFISFDFLTDHTILASLYRPNLDAEWMWREEDDQDRAEKINALWNFDYDQMSKAFALLRLLTTRASKRSSATSPSRLTKSTNPLVLIDPA